MLEVRRADSDRSEDLQWRTRIAPIRTKAIGITGKPVKAIEVKATKADRIKSRTGRIGKASRIGKIARIVREAIGKPYLLGRSRPRLVSGRG